jgi:DNA polymerase-1
LAILLELRSIETLIQTFIRPLQDLADENSRLHCSLNINTETGRLSSRRPNLQNQPALDKDKYKIRMAFEPDAGNKFIIADYGQLELRILAHMTNCKAMLDAFKQGGDFHSRTALSMYENIRKEVEEGSVLLEWDGAKGKNPVPLLKEKYAAERKKAKTMNFSIAYGKSAHGFSKDWNCSMEEAEQTLQAWFKERPEVMAWQTKTKNTAMTKGWCVTLAGRYRNLSRYFNTGNKKETLSGLRAAINTPIQGGAADIMIAAMVKLYENEELKGLGWRMIHQIHDELILEGPEGQAERAFEIVKSTMEHPLDEDLRVALEVDAKICNNWYEK